MTQSSGVVKALGYTSRNLSSSVDVITQGSADGHGVMGGRHGS